MKHNNPNECFQQWNRFGLKEEVHQFGVVRKKVFVSRLERME